VHPTNCPLIIKVSPELYSKSLLIYINDLETEIIYSNNGISIIRSGNIITVSISIGTLTISEKTWTTIYTFTDDDILPVSGLSFPIIRQVSDRFTVGLGSISREDRNIKVFFMEEVVGCMFSQSYIIY